jgi:hypothetical protein
VGPLGDIADCYFDDPRRRARSTTKPSVVDDLRKLHLLGHNVEIHTLVRLFSYFSSSILINQRDQVPILQW